jgi:hypothetical protein
MTKEKSILPEFKNEKIISSLRTFLVGALNKVSFKTNTQVPEIIEKYFIALFLFLYLLIVC